MELTENPERPWHLALPLTDWSILASVGSGADPSAVLSRAPTASAVTDCKSVCDIATKNSTPVCSEYRTTLECLLIGERLQENVGMRWISTHSGSLRESLCTGRYTLFDEDEGLKLRASKRERLQWLRNGTTVKKHGCENQ